MSRARVPRRRHLWGETQLLMEYVRATYWPHPASTNMRLGAIEPFVPRDGLSEAEKRLMGNFRRYADAVVRLDHELVVIEATMFKAVAKIGPLLEYLGLVQETPELAPYRHLPVRGELLSAIPDPRAEALCLKMGLRFVHFRVAWLDRFLSQYPANWRHAPQTQVRQEFIP